MFLKEIMKTYEITNRCIVYIYIYFVRMFICNIITGITIIHTYLYIYIKSLRYNINTILFTNVRIYICEYIYIYNMIAIITSHCSVWTVLTRR